MRSGAWPDRPVRTIQARAVLDGQVVDIDNASVTSEMTSELSVTSSGSLSSSAGSVTWSQGSAVAVAAPQPFVPVPASPPKSRTPVALQVGDGSQWWTQLTGYVDTTSGDLANGGTKSGLVDYIDRLSRTVEHEPLLAGHPPYYQYETAYRRAGLCTSYLTDLCARTAGFFSTPKSTGSTMLNAPNMGSAWPEVGELMTAHYNGVTTAPPYRVVAPWGVYLDHPDITWRLSQSFTSQTLTVLLAPAGGVKVNAYVTTGLGVWMNHGTDGTLSVGYANPSDYQLISVPVQGATRAALWVVSDGSGLHLTLRLSDGRQFSLPTVTGAWSGFAFNYVHAFGNGGIGAVVVDVAYAIETAWRALNSMPNAVLQFSSLTDFTALPRLSDKSALSLLTEQAAAECATIWIDGAGNFHWAGRDILDNADVQVVKSTDLTIDNLAWIDDLSALRQQVTAAYRLPALNRAFAPTIDLTSPQATGYTSGQVDEQWIGPTADEDWIGLDTGLAIITSIATAGAIGSIFGGVVTTDNGATEGEAWATPDQLQVTLVKVAADSYKLTTIVGTIPAPKALTTRTLSGTWTRAHLPLPWIRGTALVTWANLQDTFAAADSAPTFDYQHTFSWYVQNADDRAAIVRWIVNRVTYPRPVVTVDIDPDPRIELGDKVQLEDPDRTGLLLHLVVTSINQGYSSGQPSMTLSGRLTHIEMPWTPRTLDSAWQDLIDAWKGKL